jgi:hypothetical protein
VHDAAFADALYDRLEWRPVGSRREIVEGICSLATEVGERQATARDLGLAALLAGEWPKVTAWRETSVAAIIRAMARAMHKAHRDAGEIVAALASG